MVQSVNSGIFVDVCIELAKLACCYQIFILNETDIIAILNNIKFGLFTNSFKLLFPAVSIGLIKRFSTPF